jgi:hypothetical protein
MNKKEVMKVCKELCYKASYEILSGTHEYPTHIRLDGIGDIWPTTGTLKLNGQKNFFKSSKGVYKLAEILESKTEILHVKKGMRVEINDLKSYFEAMSEQIKHLTECLESVQYDLETLKLNN